MPMTPPRRTRMLAVAVAAGGVAACAMALAAVVLGPTPSDEQLLVASSLCLLVGATWVWPLVFYRDSESDALNLAEGAFVVMALLLPLGPAILAFATAAAVAEAVRRHSLLKVAFNWGQTVIAAALGLGVAHVIASPGPRLSVTDLAAAVLGTVVFMAANTAAMAALATTLAGKWWSALEGMGIRLRLAAGCVALGIVGALATSAYGWSLPFALLPFLILRQVLAGHFQARHDRTRLLGLFTAALAANASMGEGDPLGTILTSARTLLRCPEASVRSTPAEPGQLGAQMLVNGQTRWLVVSGRSHTEPFDPADTSLLEALAAVGAGALTNAQLYQEVQFQGERLDAITSSVADGVCALDRSGSVTFANPAAVAMLGWDGLPEPVVEQSGGHRLARPAIPPFLAAPVLQVMKTGETLRNDDAELRRDDGSVLPVAFTASPILEAGQVAGAVIILRDTTQRREAERAIRVARDQAIESSRLKSQFLANMSHEIRTPMNGVLGLSRMLLDTNLTDTQRKYLSVLQDCGENLMVIINDILDYSKIEAGKLELEEVDFDLRASLTSVTNTLAVAALDKGLAMGLDVDPALPATVRGDPVRLRQILINLVGNAIKFTESGTVTIAAGRGEAGRVRIAVSDSGIGIDPAVRAKVLSAFGQADSSTTRRYGGTGLGLAICSHLVGMMGGILDFVSQPGHGSTFWIEVPLPEGAPVISLRPLAAGEGPAPTPAPMLTLVGGTDLLSPPSPEAPVSNGAPTDGSMIPRKPERLARR